MGINKKLIGSRIQAIRKEKNRRQKDVAEAVGLTDQYISKIERGDTSVTLSTISDIADYLGVDIGALIAGTNTGAPDYCKYDLFEIMEKASPKQREAICAHARIVLKGQYLMGD
ncbi:helix-turn-helix domain-containing protein [Ruminococcaceae bacterium OttesenSCG-928-I18]|nr:helix-turn-helix domain-containing protein [Ruminococcaceae bacterium OttesenSCG-928-I18]